MITSINIEHFQSHISTSLKLDPGVNAIVGPSDCGKSAVFRALNWLINNRPGGQEFHSWDGGDPSVTLNLDNVTIARSRRANENIYTLGDQEFKAFGTTVPEPIQKALNISDINFQFQLDDPFLFGDTPGSIARKLNEVVDLAIIDKALFNINRRYRQETNQLTNAEVKKAELKDELDDYSWLADADEALEELEKLDRHIVGNKQKALALEIIIKEIGHIEIELDQVSTGPIEAENEVLELIGVSAQIDDLVEDWDNLNKLIGDITRLEKEIINAKGCLVFEPIVIKALVLDDTIEENCKQGDRLRVLLDHIHIEHQTLGNKKIQLDIMLSKFHDLMPDECPLCGQEVK